MCFIKKVELGVEPIIYPCEHQCYYYSKPLINSNPQYELMFQPFAFPTMPTLNFPTLMQQMTNDIAATVEKINQSNAILFRLN
jgi:hypothetical protein